MNIFAAIALLNTLNSEDIFKTPTVYDIPFTAYYHAAQNLSSWGGYNFAGGNVGAWV